jgi:hypothetical protein
MKPKEGEKKNKSRGNQGPDKYKIFNLILGKKFRNA